MNLSRNYLLIKNNAKKTTLNMKIYLKFILNSSICLKFHKQIGTLAQYEILYNGFLLSVSSWVGNYVMIHHLPGTDTTGF